MATTKSKAATRLVFANPYAHLDHLGRLGGACPAEASVHGGLRMAIAATYKVLSVEERDEMDSGRQDKVHAMWDFSAEGVAVPAGEMFYVDRVRDGDLLAATKAGDPPLVALGEARLAAIAWWGAAYGAEAAANLPLETWAEQYPLEKSVAEVCNVLQEQRGAAALKAKTDSAKATKAAEDTAQKAAKDAEEKAVGVLKAAIEGLKKPEKTKPESTGAGATPTNPIGS